MFAMVFASLVWITDPPIAKKWITGELFWFGGLFTYLLWTAVNPLEPLKYLVPGLTIILDLLCLGLLIQRIVSPPVAIILKSV